MLDGVTPFPITGYDLSSLRVIQSGGQRLQPEVRLRAERALPGCFIQENSGMAEGLIMFVRSSDPPEVRRETCGRLRPGRRLGFDELAGFLPDFGIATFKLPERLEIFDSLPLSGFGKVSKKDLAARLAGDAS
jgi:non-ribosomal peptide synthetase component E (peptide arylation enzyme)